MKIKVDKEEYESLLRRVKELEEDRIFCKKYLIGMYNGLEERMENFFKYKCMTVVLKRDKAEIVAEIRKKAIDNLFNEKEYER